MIRDWGLCSGFHLDPIHKNLNPFLAPDLWSADKPVAVLRLRDFLKGPDKSPVVQSVDHQRFASKGNSQPFDGRLRDHVGLPELSCSQGVG